MRVSRLLAVLGGVVLLLSMGLELSAREDNWKAAMARFKRAMASGRLEEIFDAMTHLEAFAKPEGARLVLADGINHDDILVYQEAFDYLTRLNTRETQKVVVDAALKHKRWEIRGVCVRVLASYPGEYIYDKIKEIIAKDRKWQPRSAAIRAIAFQRRKESVPYLIDLLGSEKMGRVRWDISQALTRLTGETLGDDLLGWKRWWVIQKEDYEIPSPEELAGRAEKDTDSREDLQTAVAEGLYGPILSERVIFIFDTSGSMSQGTEMQGARIDIAKRELAKVLTNLSNKSYFNVIAFSDQVIAFKPRLQRARQKTIEKAYKFIEKQRAAGETNVHAAFELAFKDEECDTIYFLSDGSPSIGKVIPQAIQQDVLDWNRHRRIVIHCVGFFPGEANDEDKEAAGQFMLRLAHDNDGFYKEIY